MSSSIMAMVKNTANLNDRARPAVALLQNKNAADEKIICGIFIKKRGAYSTT